MIEVKYNCPYNKISVQGHAGAGKKGEDLVCSAASILVHTLQANVEHMQAAGCAFDCKADVQDGSARISCKARPGYDGLVKRTFASVCVGFEILANKFPEYISYKIMG